MKSYNYEMAEILLRAAGEKRIPVSKVKRPEIAHQFIQRIDSTFFGIVGLDLTLDVNGNIRLIEANGSNMGATSFGDPEGDALRAKHFVQSARSRLDKTCRGVVIMPYALGTGLLPEHVERARLVACEVAKLMPTILSDANEIVGEQMTVVVDNVRAIADHVTREHRALLFKGVPVIAAANPNILAELVRRGIVGREGLGYSIDESIFHEGPLLALIHDKGLQQDIAIGTGIKHQRHYNCDSIERCVEAVAELHRSGATAVVKMNAGSGGHGIEFMTPNMSTDELKHSLEVLLSDAASNYGDVTESVWPLRVFEFVQATAYCDPALDGGRLWDMRVACFISPGALEMTFCGMRLCPEAFTGTFSRGAVLSNTTGRLPATTYIKSPITERDGPSHHLRRVGIDEVMFKKIIVAATNWCRAACHFATHQRDVVIRDAMMSDSHVTNIA